jgi:hypothetical protein
MKPVVWKIAAVLVVVFCLAVSPAVAAQQAPYWPSEREERLKEVHALIFDTMGEIAAANYYGRAEEVDQLVEKLKALTSEQARLREPPVRAESAQK